MEPAARPPDANAPCPEAADKMEAEAEAAAIAMLEFSHTICVGEAESTLQDPRFVADELGDMGASHYDVFA